MIIFVAKKNVYHKIAELGLKLATILLLSVFVRDESKIFHNLIY